MVNGKMVNAFTSLLFLLLGLSRLRPFRGTEYAKFRTDAYIL